MESNNELIDGVLGLLVNNYGYGTVLRNLRSFAPDEEQIWGKAARMSSNIERIQFVRKELGFRLREAKKQVDERFGEEPLLPPHLLKS